MKLLTKARAKAPNTALHIPIRKLKPSTALAAKAKIITLITKAKSPDSKPRVRTLGIKNTALKIGMIKTFKIPKTAAETMAFGRTVNLNANR